MRRCLDASDKWCSSPSSLSFVYGSLCFIMSAVITHELNMSLGPVYLGVVVAGILSGMTSVQAFTYYERYPEDWIIYRVSVGLLWLLDAAHLGVTIQVGYHYLVESYGDLPVLLEISTPLKVQVALNVVIILIVQCLYALRIWKLGNGFRSRLIPVIVGFIVLGGFAVGIILVVGTFRAAKFTDINHISGEVYASFSASTFIDVVIVLAMFYYLSPTHSEMPKTKSMLSKLLNYAVGSGLLTSTCSLSALITYRVLSDTLVFLGIEIILTKLYVNSFLAMLNARRGIRDQGHTDSISLISSLHHAAIRSAHADGGIEHGTSMVVLKQHYDMDAPISRSFNGIERAYSDKVYDGSET